MIGKAARQTRASLPAIASLLLVAMFLGGCADSLVKGVEDIKAGVLSPVIVLSDQNSVGLGANATLSFPATAPGESKDITLTIGNAGKHDLVAEIPSNAVTMESGTESSSFALVNPPSAPVTLKTSQTAQFSLRFSPSASGTKMATVVISTNDLDHPTFGFTISGYSIPAPLTPAGLTVSQVTIGSAVSKSTSLNISWSPAQYATSYTVIRYSSGHVKLAELDPVSGTSTVDVGLSCGTNYEYAVVAKNPAGMSTEQTHVAEIVAGTPATSVTLSTASTKILNLTNAWCAVGDTVGVSATVSASASVQSCSWSSSNTIIATVDASGNVSALGKGSAVITAACQDNTGRSDSFTINTTALGAPGEAGLVFYDKGSYSSSWRFMEAATGDQNAGLDTMWTEWSSLSHGFILSNNGAAVGTGKTNTSLIIAAAAANVPPKTAYAASACAGSIGGKNDWFLPSKDELHEMYVKLRGMGIGNFAALGYWSSSCADAQPSWCVVWAEYFITSPVVQYLYSANSTSTYRVRAARQF